MDIIKTFENFAAGFEATVEDDDWSRLEKYLTEDVTYVNVGSPDPKSRGRSAVLDFLKADVANTDRRFDSRTLKALTPPKVEGNRLSRRWRCTYTLAGAPDLVIDGVARYIFEGDLIKEIEEEVNSAAMQKVAEWIQKYGDGLQV